MKSIEDMMLDWELSISKAHLTAFKKKKKKEDILKDVQDKKNYLKFFFFFQIDKILLIFTNAKRYRHQSISNPAFNIPTPKFFFFIELLFWNINTVATLD